TAGPLPPAGRPVDRHRGRAHSRQLTMCAGSDPAGIGKDAYATGASAPGRSSLPVQERRCRYDVSELRPTVPRCYAVSGGCRKDRQDAARCRLRIAAEGPASSGALRSLSSPWRREPTGSAMSEQQTLRFLAWVFGGLVLSLFILNAAAMP